jgi:putative ABC transport system permease protein
MKQALAISLAGSFAKGRLADLTLMALAVALAVFVAASVAGASAAFFIEMRHLQADPSYLEIRATPSAISRDRSKAVTLLDENPARGFVMPGDAASEAMIESPAVHLAYNYDIMAMRVGEAPQAAGGIPGDIVGAFATAMGGAGQGGLGGGLAGRTAGGSTGGTAQTPGAAGTTTAPAAANPGSATPQDGGLGSLAAGIDPAMVTELRNRFMEGGMGPDGPVPGIFNQQASAEELAEAARLETPLLEVLSAARVDTAFFEAYGLTASTGSLFTTDEISANRAMLVLGADLAERLYADGKALGKRVRLDSRTYDIIGILTRTPYTTDRDWNGMAFVPSREIQLGPAGANIRIRSTRLMFAARDAGSVANAESQLKAYFDRTMGAGLVTISSRKAELDERVKSQTTLFAAAFGLTALCVLVAILNLMNASATKAIKRRRSLGVLRAIGASSADIVAAAFWETAISAVLGLVVGYIAAMALSDSTASLLVPYTRTNGGAIPAMTIAALLAMAIPLVLGVLPSWNAMRTAPADLVRPE